MNDRSVEWRLLGVGTTGGRGKERIDEEYFICIEENRIMESVNIV
jgi:hypothetical protein